MSAYGPKRTSRVAPHMSASGGKADMTVCGCLLSRSLLGVLRTLGSSSANYAHKIGHFLDYLLPRKRRWEAHGKQIADGKKLLWVALARAKRRDPSLVRYGMPALLAQSGHSDRTSSALAPQSSLRRRSLLAVNAASASYAIFSNGLSLYPKRSRPSAYRRRNCSGPRSRH